MKVQVFDGSGDDFLGFGDLVGNVTVYVIAKPDGSIVSLPNAEERPSDEVIAEHEGELIAIEDNPKIVLDDGRVVYGCQVFWHAANVN